MENSRRFKRRLVGLLQARLPELGLERLPDPRSRSHRRWRLPVLLGAVLVAMMSGRRSLAEVEALTAEMSRSMRRALGIGRRIADTTLRDLLCALDPRALRPALHALVRAAHRRKALRPEGLPFGVLSLDGKATAIEGGGADYAQPHTRDDGAVYHVIRTITASLTSARGRPCIDVMPIDADTNEMGAFERVLDALQDGYGKLLHSMVRVLTYDAGACSLYNAGLIARRGFDYVLRLNDSQPTMLAEAERVLGPLGPEHAEAVTEDVDSGHVVVRRLYRTEQMAGWMDWEHLRTVFRVDSETYDRHGQRRHGETRYYLGSLSSHALSPKQWLRLIRGHWGVENNCHHTYDVAFKEDERPWITHSAQGFAATLVLRRIAATLLTLFRSVTQRSDERRAMPWRDLLRCMYNTLISATETHVGGLRPRAWGLAAPH